jgi:hypothetical protein
MIKELNWSILNLNDYLHHAKSQPNISHVGHNVQLPTTLSE